MSKGKPPKWKPVYRFGGGRWDGPVKLPGPGVAPLPWSRPKAKRKRPK